MPEITMRPVWSVRALTIRRTAAAWFIKGSRKLDFVSRGRCVADEKFDRIFSNQFSTVLRVPLIVGRGSTGACLPQPRGAENLLSDEELEVKFRTNAGYGLPEGRL